MMSTLEYYFMCLATRALLLVRIKDPGKIPTPKLKKERPVHISDICCLSMKQAVGKRLADYSRHYEETNHYKPAFTILFFGFALVFFQCALVYTSSQIPNKHKEKDAHEA